MELTRPPDQKENPSQIIIRAPHLSLCPCTDERSWHRGGSRQGSIIDKCLRAGTDWVEDEEGCIAEPKNLINFNIKEGKGVERVADDFSERPREDHGRVKGRDAGLKIGQKCESLNNLFPNVEKKQSHAQIQTVHKHPRPRITDSLPAQQWSARDSLPNPARHAVPRVSLNSAQALFRVRQ